ncbi:MAG TPA: hypothetical protein VKA38_07870 [Draconibacterium sp.]|nr:hypothetical protein [Draconibacterium sp.]
MMKPKLYRILIFLFAGIIFFGCSAPKTKTDKIDRFALVARHNVTVNAFDSLSSLSVGNGGFAFTVDATGLQTFPEIYKNGVCLGTMSNWGWHSFPNAENFKLEETYRYYDVEGRKVPYAVQWNKPERKKEASNYFRVNEHRLHLGIVGLELTHSNGSLVGSDEISEIDQHLNLWEGLISSSFKLEGETVNTQTCCHPEKDMIGVHINSDDIKKGLLGIKIRFPYPSGGHVDDGCNWNSPDKHQSEIIKLETNSAILKHTIDTTTYFVKLNWKGKADLFEKAPHYFVLKPAPENTSFSASVEFNKTQNFAANPDFESIKNLSAQQWKNFWETGGAVDFSGTNDPRAAELERRVVLSQYLTRVQCAGDLPPQETGLTFNSWYGKFHMEMHWWHSAHWALWNRTDILEKSMNYYNTIFQKAKDKAEIQGYEGVRWPKMTDPTGTDSPSGVGEFLIWQEPHIIYFAEECYRQRPDKATLDKYAPLVFATANFMADFARKDEKNNRYILGPPLIPAQESLEKEKTMNPPFEIAYWYWGLSIAQKWRERLNLDKNPEWQAVIDGLPPFAQKDGLYLAAESAPDSYTNQRYISDHPMVLGAFGIIPNTVKIDTAVMAKTFDYIENIWNWPSTWGWDYPMAAMCATRLGKPEQAVNMLLKDVLKNTYLVNGHNYQGTRLRIYLPGNGGLLTAVAMMCAGFEGNTTKNPGFPKDWKVKWENLEPVF